MLQIVGTSTGIGAEEELQGVAPPVDPSSLGSSATVIEGASDAGISPSGGGQRGRVSIAGSFANPQIAPSLTNPSSCEEYKAAYANAYSNAVKENEPLVKNAAKVYGAIFTGAVGAIAADALVEGQTFSTGLSSLDAQAATNISQNLTLLKSWNGAAVGVSVGLLSPYDKFSQAFAPDVTDFTSFQANFQLVVNSPAVCQNR